MWLRLREVDFDTGSGDPERQNQRKLCWVNRGRDDVEGTKSEGKRVPTGRPVELEEVRTGERSDKGRHIGLTDTTNLNLGQ